MTIGERLRTLRKARGLSQAEVEKRTGLMWCYVSRLENGHVTPGLQTLEKLARALEVPLYQILYEGEEPKPAKRAARARAGEPLFGDKGKQSRVLQKFVENLARMSEEDRDLLYSMAQQMANDRNARAVIGTTKRRHRARARADSEEPSDRRDDRAAREQHEASSGKGPPEAFTEKPETESIPERRNFRRSAKAEDGRL
jgi:transcriptional regulator with XRE-family HTH domain